MTSDSDKFPTASTASSEVSLYVAQGDEAAIGHVVERLRSLPGYRIAGKATDAAQLEALIRDVPGERRALITDVALGADEDVTPTIARLKKRFPDLDILVYTSRSQDSIVIRAVLAGAMGYLLKGDQEDIATGLLLLQGGGSPVSPTVARSVLRAVHSRAVRTAPRAKPRPNALPGEPNDLSKREIEILTLLAKGMSFAEIGQILSISTHTVTAHIKKIYRKLQVHSRGEAVYEATCLGILSGRSLSSRF